MSTSPIDKICHVCGDTTATMNYGALTCASCRTFFRRNGFDTTDVIPCGHNGLCEITKSTRKHCTACRLAKCLAIGMSPELIRKEDLSQRKRKTPDDPQLVMTNPPPTTATANLDTVASESVYLNPSEWITVSNILHAFDTFNPLNDIRRNIQTLLTTNQPVDHLHLLSTYSNSLQLFIGSIPDFQILTTAEKWSLLQRNILGLLSIGSLYFMREYSTIITPSYEHEIIDKLKYFCTQLDYDPIVIKLFLVILAFSSNCFPNTYRTTFETDRVLHGTHRLFDSQNVYLEVLWKYFIHRYNFFPTIERFSRLIQILVKMIDLFSEIYETNDLFKHFFTELIEQIERSPIINEQTIIPLWGNG